MKRVAEDVEETLALEGGEGEGCFLGDAVVVHGFGVLVLLLF